MRSLRSLLMPVISERLLSARRLEQLRSRAEGARRAKGDPHRLHYFHQVDDPYSALMADVLPQLLERYDVQVTVHVVGPPPDGAAPDRERLVAYSRRDAELLARRHGLGFHDAGRQPPGDAVTQATRVLVAAAARGTFVDVAAGVCARLWSFEADPGAGAPQATPGEADAHLAESAALRRRLGHYLGATLYYAGEWYWGIDRLYLLEQRLQQLGAQRLGVAGALYPQDADLAESMPLEDPPPIDFFFSFRSPYSAIVAPRVFDLGQRTGAPVRLRYVLPMVMRGLAVPREKRMYISLDAAREARSRGIPFGRVNDPVGRPVERGLSLVPLAERNGLGPAYVLSFMRGVWAEGLDAGTDPHLRRIAERAGLAWADAQAAMRDEGWRAVAEANRVEMLSLGLWGVPSFRVGHTSVWGQDRLWAVTAALREKEPRP